MYYRINDCIGKLKNIESFTELIAEHLKYKREVSVIPLAETRDKLFQAIIDKAFEIKGVATAVVDMANLHLEGTTVDYDDVTYSYLTEVICHLCKEIDILAAATGCEKDDFLEPVLKEREAGREEKS